MRFLGIGKTCDLGSMYHRLARAGHEVRVFVEDEHSHDVFGGLLHRTGDWRAELAWLRGGGPGAGPRGDGEGVLLFESACKGGWQDELRTAGYAVVGGSAYGDRLEEDRAFGQAVLRDAGLSTAASHSFRSYEAAQAFLRERPGRYVCKSNGANALRTRNYVGQLASGIDMLAYLQLEEAHAGHAAQSPGHAADVDFVLMEHVQGVEVGVGAYFNGERFLQPALLDWEHKHFFPGEQGELTGEMGTIVSYRGAELLFERTLAPLAESLRAAGHCGYINVNLIVNADGIWPLEFTSRFGYPGYAICEALHQDTWDVVLRQMLDRRSTTLRTRPGFACGVVLTVPPFPYTFGYETLSKGAPICDREGCSAQELLSQSGLHFGEVALAHGQLVASGASGYIGVATGAGHDIAAAQREAYANAGKVVVPNLRYRDDIGDRVAATELAQLAAGGYLPAPGSAAADSDEGAPLSVGARGVP